MIDQKEPVDYIQQGLPMVAVVMKIGPGLAAIVILVDLVQTDSV